jgi:hypothetical protein
LSIAVYGSEHCDATTPASAAESAWVCGATSHDASQLCCVRLPRGSGEHRPVVASQAKVFTMAAAPRAQKLDFYFGRNK